DKPYELSSPTGHNSVILPKRSVLNTEWSPDAGAEKEQSKNQADRRVEGQDPLLHPFLRAPNEDSAKAELDILFQAEAIPIIQKIINQRLGAGSISRKPDSMDQRDLDIQDLRQQTLMALTAHLSQVYTNPKKSRIN